MDERIKRLRQAIEQSGLTYAELGERTGIAKSSLQRYATGETKKIPIDCIEAIAKATNTSAKNLMGWEDPQEQPQSDKLYVLDQGKIRQIPIYESVSAGFGASASDYVVDYMPLYIDSDSEAEETIGIRVVGNSMYPKIEEGDIIQVRKQSDVDSGKVAVVMIDGEDFVVKRFYHEKNRIVLKSFNPEYPPKVFEGKEMARIQIVGLVRSVIKKL